MCLNCIYVSLASSFIYGLFIALVLFFYLKNAVKIAISITAVSLSLNILLCYTGLLFGDNVSALYSVERFDAIEMNADSSSVKQLLGEPIRRRVKDWEQGKLGYIENSDSLLWEFRVDKEDAALDALLLLFTGINRFRVRPCDKTFVLISRSTGRVFRKGGFCDLREG